MKGLSSVGKRDPPHPIEPRRGQPGVVLLVDSNIHGHGMLGQEPTAHLEDNDFCNALCTIILLWRYYIVQFLPTQSLGT